MNVPAQPPVRQPRVRPRGQPLPVVRWLGLAALPALLVACSNEDVGPEGQPSRYHLDQVLRINQIQVKGTHNSYHRKPAIVLKPWDYEHAPLLVQLERQGVRQLELDIYWNAGAGGYDVHHVAQIDAETTCATLALCLQEVRRWLSRHPDALPPMIWLEPKDYGEPSASTPPYARLEAEIRAIPWPRGILTPDEVRGSAQDLRSAVAAGGWPTLGAVRGKPMFVMLDNGKHRDAYVGPDPSLKGRVLFAEGGAEDPWGVLAKIDDPVGGQQAILEAVRAGRLVRTRADADSAQAATNDRTRLQAALESGAQAISTDYPARVLGTDYVVEIPGGTPARCNPVTAPPECTSAELEKLDPVPLSDF